MNKPFRTEYPRPNFVREPWLNLNGTWAFAFDDADVGCDRRWYDSAQHNDPFDLSIEVPFVYQSQLSGLEERAFHNVMWYRRAFDLPTGWREPA